MLYYLTGLRHEDVLCVLSNSLEESHNVGAASADFLQCCRCSSGSVHLRFLSLCPALSGASSRHGDKAADDVDVVTAEGHQFCDTVLKSPIESLTVLLLDETLKGQLRGDVLDQLPVCRGHVVPHAC